MKYRICLWLAYGTLMIAGLGCCCQQDPRQLALVGSEEITINVRNGDDQAITLQSSDPTSVPDRVLQPGEVQPLRFRVTRLVAMRQVEQLPVDNDTGWIDVPEGQTTLEIRTDLATPFLRDDDGDNAQLPIRTADGQDWTRVIELSRCLLFRKLPPVDLKIAGEPDESGAVRLCDDDEE